MMSNMFKVPFLTGVRRLFYAVTPNETFFENTSEVPQYINEANPFFFMCIFLELVVSLYKNDKKVRLNDGATSVSAGMFSRLPMVVIPSIALASYVWIYERFCIVQLPWDSAWTWWLCFLGVDMGYYWFHRFAHEVNFMWAAHQVHHSSEYYNFTTALRQSVLQIYTSWIFYLPLALFVPPSVYLVHAELNILYQFWIHTQYVKSLGPLEYILNTPSHHRVHHGRNPYCIDKNYAGTLIIWDRLFGTFQAEEEEVVYGLTHPINTFEPLEIQFGFLKYMIGLFKNMKRYQHKLATLFYGPGWSPGKPRTGDIEDIPKVKAPWKQYNVKCPTWVNVYVAVHFLMVLIAYQELAARKAGLTQTSVICFLVYIGFSLSCFGRIFDQSSISPYYETLRLSITLLGEIFLCQIGFYGMPGHRPVFVYILQIIFIMSLTLWLTLTFRITTKIKTKAQ